jgi:hypothetical protein
MDKNQQKQNYEYLKNHNNDTIKISSIHSNKATLSYFK